MASRSGPKSDSSTITLGTPTDEEQFSAWAITSSEWKGPLPFEAYINREKYLSNQEATKNGGIRFWILYDTAEVLEKSQQRTILASCETLKRKAIISYCVNGSWKLEEVISYGVASVFCRKEFRMKGYARRMIAELGHILDSSQNHIMGSERCAFSVLYSVVGMVIPHTLLGIQSTKSYRSSTHTRNSTAFLQADFRFGIEQRK